MRYFVLFMALVMNLLTIAQNPSVQFVENTVRVKFKPTVSLNHESNERVADSRGFLSVGLNSFDQLSQKFQASSMSRVFPNAGKFEERHKEYGLHLWYDVKVAGNTSVETLTSQFGALDIISHANPVGIYNTEAGEAEVIDTNDPMLPEQWHYENYGQTGGTSGADISLFEAWDDETGDPRIIVSVHDSGLDIYHPDIANRVWTNPGEIANDGIDNDNNGFIDDYYGYNFAAAVVGGDPTDVFDFGGHGTHTSGTIAAENNNGIGVAGVAGGSTSGDGVRIMTLRLGDDAGSPYIYNPAPSFVYAADMGSVISSNSWGGGSYDQSLVDAISYYTSVVNSSALSGGLVIFSAGNSSSSSADYKADLPNVMMVAATNHNDQLSWYSNFGSWVDISAPGGETSITYEGVLSTLPYQNYGFYQGTSMACPHVSGVAALLASKAYGTGLTNAQLFDALVSSTDPIDDINPSYVGQLGSGRLNAKAALDAVASGGGGGSSGELIIDPFRITTEIQEGKEETYNIRLANTTSYEISVDIDQQNDADWVSVNAANLSIPANSAAKFQITLNSSEVGITVQETINFTYLSFDAKVTSSLPISLYTLGDPAISSVDTLIFNTTYVGKTVTQGIQLLNSGANYLEISSATIQGADFSVSEFNTTLAPEASVYLPVNFHPTTDSTRIDTLELTTNIPNNEIYQIVLKGYGNPRTPPQISVNPGSLEFTTTSSGYQIDNFTVTNTGEDPLEYYITANPFDYLPLEQLIATSDINKKKDTKDTPPSTNAVGEILHHISSPVNQESGLAWDGEYLWIRDALSQNIYQFDTENEVILDTIVSTSYSSNTRIDIYDNVLYEYSQNENQINKYDLESKEAFSSIELNRYHEEGISVNQRGIWLASNNRFYLYDADNGDELDNFSNSRAYDAFALESYDDKLVLLRSDGYLYNIQTGESGYTSSGNINDEYYLGNVDIAFDGENAWVVLNNYGIIVKVDIFPDFTYVYSNSGYLDAGESRTHTVEANFYNLSSGRSYHDELVITSNALENSRLTIPIEGNFLGTPVLEVSDTRMNFDAYLGYTSTDTLEISNGGNETLEISSISSSRGLFDFDGNPVNIGAFESHLLPVSISMSSLDTLYDTLAIYSNYAEQPVQKIYLRAIGFNAPSISVDVESFELSLYQHDYDSLPITITNNGTGKLVYEFPNSSYGGINQSVLQSFEGKHTGPILATKDAEPPTTQQKNTSTSSPIEANSNTLPLGHNLDITGVSENLSENYGLISRLIPSRFDFYDGETNYYINDGGNDMYDGGNYLHINNSYNYIYYTNGSVDQSGPYQGMGDYFTAKYPGLFVLCADLDDAQTFTIEGDLGADGSGSADGSVLSVTKAGKQYLGFVKRVYDAYDPSVNHLIIVENNGSVNHSIDTYTNSDFHQLNDMGGITRLSYLLFASASGGYINDSQMLEIMSTYLDVIGEGANIDGLEPNESITEHLYFNSFQRDTGTYEYDVKLLSNDPDNSVINIPTTLTVNSSPILYTNQNINFGSYYVGTQAHQTAIIDNLGHDTLFIQGYDSLGSAAFTYENLPDTVLPGQTEVFYIAFFPDAAAHLTASLVISSNDLRRENTTISLTGTGLPSSLLELDSYYTLDTVGINSKTNFTVQAQSLGSDSISYRVVIQEAVSYYELEQQIERVRQQSGIYNSNITFDATSTPDGETIASRVTDNPDEIAGIRQSSGANNILILYSDSYSRFVDVLNMLDNSGEYASISYESIEYNNYFTIEDLINYDAIFLWDYYGINESNALGNLLATYIDLGGGVVTAAYQHDYNGLQGNWSQPKYRLYKDVYIGNITGYDYAYLGADSDFDHPLLAQVDTLNGGYYSIRSSATRDDVSNAAEVVAKWSDGSPLIVSSTDESIRRVDLSLYPPSSNSSYRYWSVDTDGLQIMINAINHVAGGIKGSQVDWLSASSYEGSLAVDETSDITFTLDTEGLEEGWLAARAWVFSNDSRNNTHIHNFDFFNRGTPEFDAADTVDLGEVSFGFTSSGNLSVRNTGTGAGTVRLELDSSSVFNINGVNDSINIPAYNSYNYNIQISPDTGTILDEATLHTVDDGTSQRVIIKAKVTEPGKIRIEPAELDLNVPYQGSTDSSFYIHNDGAGDLKFVLESYRLPNETGNQKQNNTTPIEFNTTLNKGSRDTRKGHEVLAGFGADVYGYSFIDSREADGPSYIWNDISATGQAIALGDDASKSIDLPFEFPIYGLRKNKVYVSSNGFLTFENQGSNNPINSQVPSQNAPNGIIAPFWKDLTPQNGGDIYYMVEEDQLTVQYENVPDYDQTGTFTFQVALHKTGDIELFYKDMNGLTTDATVGIESPSNALGLQIAFNTDYIANNLAVYIANPVQQVVPEITKGSVAPGDSLKVPFTYNALEDMGGTHNQFISILANDTINHLSSVELNVFVDGIASVRLFNDSLHLDTTYVNQVSREKLWFSSDSVGMLTIEEVISTNESFKVLFPEYGYKSNETETKISIDLNPGFDYLEGTIQGLGSEIIAAKLFSQGDNEKDLIANLDFHNSDSIDYVYLDNLNLSNQATWQLANGDVYLEIFTADNPSGLGALNINKLIHSVAPYEYSRQFEVLYRPTDATADTASFTLVSNAHNSENVEVFATGFGRSSNVTINLSYDPIEFDLVTPDSTEAQITVANTGADTLNVYISSSNYQFESSFQPVGFDSFSTSSVSPDKSAKSGEFQISENTTKGKSSQPERSLSMDSSFEFFGMFYTSSQRSFVSGFTDSPENLTVLSNYSFGGYFVSGLEFFNHSEILALDERGTIYKSDLSTDFWEIIGYVGNGGIFTGMTTDPSTGEMYVSTNYDLYKFDPNELSIKHIGPFNIPGYMKAIAIDQNGELYAYSTGDIFYQVNKNSGSVTEIGNIGFNAEFGQDMAFNSADGNLYMAALNINRDRAELRLVNVATGNTTYLGDIGAGSTSYTQMGSLAFKNEIQQGFVRLDSSKMSLAPGESKVLSLKIHSENLNNGKHMADVIFRSNDLSNPRVKVPVTLNVSGNYPAIEDYTNAIKFGFHTVMDTVTDYISISNSGKEVLELILQNESEAYHTPYHTGDTLKIDIGTTETYKVSFIPPAEGTFEYNMTWSSNDPNQETLTTNLSGGAERAPYELDLNEEAFHLTMLRNEVMDLELILNSMGEDSVSVTVELDSIQPWISADSTNYILAPDSSRTHLMAINTAGLALGEYEANLTLRSNDPLYYNMNIPVMLTVENGKVHNLNDFEGGLVAIGEPETSLLFSLKEYIEDLDGDSLTHTVNLNGAVDATIQKDTLVVSGISFGMDTIRLQTVDSYGDTLNSSFSVFSNTRPSSSGLPDFYIRANDGITAITDLDDHFGDADGQALTYSIVGDTTTSKIGSLTIDDDNVIILKPKAIGISSVVVTAFDGHHYQTDTFQLTIDVPLSVAEDLSNSLVVYPNPADDQVLIQYSLTKAQDINLQFVDLSGKSVLDTNLTSKTDQYKIQLDITTLKSGVYILQFMVNSDIVFSQKIIKQ